jgi:hypothetical protein
MHVVLAVRQAEMLVAKSRTDSVIKNTWSYRASPGEAPDGRVQYDEEDWYVDSTRQLSTAAVFDCDFVVVQQPTVKVDTALRVHIDTFATAQSDNCPSDITLFCIYLR